MKKQPGSRSAFAPSPAHHGLYLPKRFAPKTPHTKFSKSWLDQMDLEKLNLMASSSSDSGCCATVSDVHAYQLDTFNDGFPIPKTVLKWDSHQEQTFVDSEHILWAGMGISGCLCGECLTFMVKFGSTLASSYPDPFVDVSGNIGIGWDNYGTLVYEVKRESPMLNDFNPCWSPKEILKNIASSNNNTAVFNGVDFSSSTMEMVCQCTAFYSLDSSKTTNCEIRIQIHYCDDHL